MRENKIMSHTSTGFIYPGCDFWRIGPFCSDTLSSSGFESISRAVNSHALSVSLTHGHYFSRSHARHLKSPAWMRNIPPRMQNFTHQGKDNQFFLFVFVFVFVFACHFFLKLKPIYNLTDVDVKSTANYQNIIIFVHVLVPHAKQFS